MSSPLRGVARVISKLGLGSRTQAAAWVREGRVCVNGKLVHDPEHPVRQGVDRISIDDVEALGRARVVVMLNKPRGLVTSVRDEHGRATVYSCFEGSDLPWLAPIGRLDKASEGLILFSNDPVWSARVTDPASGPDKQYHVQIDRVPDGELLQGLAGGVLVDGEKLAVKTVLLLRSGEKNAWLAITLDEGRNRQIRRLLEAFDVAVLRLVRVAIGSLSLGDLPKGAWRELTPTEIQTLV